MHNPVLESIRPVIEKLRHVQINFDAVERYRIDLKNANSSEMGFGPFDFSVFSEQDQLHILLLLCATNFCYWGDPKWSPKMGEQKLGGQWGNTFCLIRALGNGIPITSAEYLAKMTLQDCQKLYEANTEIPLLEERWKIFQEIGRGLQKYNGDFRNIIALGGGDAWDFLNHLTKLFPSFDDSYVVDGKKVIFYKRAQLFVAFLENFFPETFGNFNNAELTAFADYKQPIVLSRLGLITIAPALRDRIIQNQEIQEGSQEEIELRAVQVWICELTRKRLLHQDPRVTAPLVSTHFWLLAKQKVVGDIPHHRTRTTRY
jgi:hypothetical protein